MNHEPRIIMLATDLMFSSNVSGFSADRKVKFKRVDSVEDFTTELQSTKDTLVIIDLGVDQLNLDATFQAIPESLKPNTIAFAPHVHVEKLKAAEQAGIGHVMSRGQFSAQTGRIVHGFKDQFETK
ncbi:MAG: hypothetical protein ABJZ55_00330 [Fuerstiella sp.]